MPEPEIIDQSPLPPQFNPRVVYLDQCAISGIAKVKDAFWTDLNRELRDLLKRQFIICPSSRFHYEESVRSKAWRTKLQAVYQELAGPYRFRTQGEIALVQLQRALRTFLGETDEPVMAFSEFCQSGANGNPVCLRQNDGPSHDTMRQVAHSSKRNHLDFSYAVAVAIRRYIERLLQAYAVGEKVAVALLESLESEVVRIRPQERQPMAVVNDFLAPENLQTVPFLDILGQLWATIAQHIQSSVKPRRAKPGDNFDVEAIAYYGPYCHAMFVDNEFRKLASQRNVDVPGRYGVQLYSETNRADFKALYSDNYFSGLTTIRIPG